MSSSSMATTASSSLSSVSSSTTTTTTATPMESSETVSEQRPQAGPLPLKRGEIGYREGVYASGSLQEISSSDAPALPERHPADRDAPPPLPPVPSSPPPPATPVAGAATAAVPVNGVSEAVTADDASSTTSMGKRKRPCLGFLRPKNVPKYWGIRLTTLILFFLQLFFIIGTIATWAIAIQILMHGSLNGSKSSSSSSSSSNDNSNSNNSNNNNNQPPGASSAIFVHVVFGICLLAQLLFFERRLYRLRAERYAYIHPGEILPTSRTRLVDDPWIAISPWNRPPLPTYAAALAQSGVGTGDVEDHLIAAPPPPAYGNTRGSRMILTGFLRDSLRAQRPASLQSNASTVRTHQGTEPGTRPASYASMDSEWEIIQDADRARQLEETLGRLENHSTSR